MGPGDGSCLSAAASQTPASLALAGIEAQCSPGASTTTPLTQHLQRALPQPDENQNVNRFISPDRHIYLTAHWKSLSQLNRIVPMSSLQ